MTISIGPIRFFRSASRNSATVFASTPALRAARPALLEVVLAAFRAFCWRPRACPPFLAAARRLEVEAEPPARELDERELAERDDVERALEDREAPERDDPERDEPERDDALLRLRDELDERLEPLDFFEPPLDFLEPPLDFPLLRRCAI